VLAESIKLSVSGLSFSALAQGPSDGPLVILLHGFPQYADAWLPTMDRLAAKGFRAIAIDQRGYSLGARPQSVSDYSIENLVQDVLNIADSLKAKTFHLVGHDWGGMVAWHLAATAPHRLISLTSLSTPHPEALKKARAKDFDQQKKSLYILLFRTPFHLAERVLKAQQWKLFRMMYQGRVKKSAIDRNIKRMSERNGLTAALNWYRAYKGKADPSAVPTLFIWGSEDVALGEYAAKETRAYVSGPYQFEVLEGASHWLMDEAPDAVGDILLKHLAAFSS
jgi:pimeloyl-ACP methyl ester carboxylesterase